MAPSFMFIVQSLIHGEAVSHGLPKAILTEIIPHIVILYGLGHYLHSMLIMFLFTITLVHFMYTMVIFGIRLFVAVWSDIYRGLQAASRYSRSTPMNYYRQDAAPFPCTHRKPPPMMEYYYPMYKQAIYRTHYLRYHNENRPLDICGVCEENFSKWDLYGNPWDSDKEQQTSPNVCITQCGHLFHTHCLWEHFVEKNRDYWHSQNVNCPFTCGVAQWDYHTMLYEPEYIKENHLMIALLATIQTTYPQLTWTGLRNKLMKVCFFFPFIFFSFNIAKTSCDIAKTHNI